MTMLKDHEGKGTLVESLSIGEEIFYPLPKMNEKIEKLSEIADDYADNYLSSHGEYHPDWHTVRDNKFAELIVLECRDIIYDISPTDDLSFKLYCAIIDHFGIE